MKRNIYNWIIPALLFVFIFTACDEYLDVKPKGVQVLETVTDYDQWLNSTDLEFYLPEEMLELMDNVDYPYLDIAVNELSGTSEYIYTWTSQYSLDMSDFPIIWTNLYATIYLYNTVLEEVNDATVGAEQEKERLKAEALLGRAFDYLFLVNLYGKQYNSSTAGEDLAVPFVTSNDLNEPIPGRSTVQQIYDHIITDLTAAIPHLKQDNSLNRFRGTVAGAYSVLARTYLYMRDYEKAAQNAQLALNNTKDTILDYSAMDSDSDIPTLIARPGVIYAKLAEQYGYYPYPTLEFLQSFDANDLRLKFYYENLDDYSFTTRGQVRYNSYGTSYGKAYPNWGTSVSEMHLILAEVAARNNDLNTAVDELNILRKNRFLPEDYVEYESSNQEEVLQKILTERALEFPFNGMRWFDMRRLDAENRMPAVVRYDRNDVTVATLAPGSPKYTLQIPIQIMDFHHDWEQNPWVEE